MGEFFQAYVRKVTEKREAKLTFAPQAWTSRGSNGYPDVPGGRLANKIGSASSSKFRDFVDEIDCTLSSVAEALPPNVWNQMRREFDERQSPRINGSLQPPDTRAADWGYFVGT